MSCIISPSGKLIDVLKPKPSDFEIEDIANGLVSGKCERYSGRTREPYYVAEHSVHVANLMAARLTGDSSFHELNHLCPEKLTQAALLHDAAEAYLGDILMPLKQQLPDYKEIELRFEYAIAERFEIPFYYFTCPLVKKMDQAVFHCEVRKVAQDPILFYGVDHSTNYIALQALGDCDSLTQMGWSRNRAFHEFRQLCSILNIK